MIIVPADKLAAAVDKYLKPGVIRRVSQQQKETPIDQRKTS